MLPLREVGSTNTLMNRLPSYTQPGSSTEVRLFLGLGVAAASLIALTLVDAGRFSNHREEIAAALSAPTTVLAAAPTNSALTNLAVMRSGTPEERARLGGPAKPKS
jgi:hypothetical protein